MRMFANVRNSDELPDDVGTVFVAVSERYPRFGALGRRDPENRELCVGTIFMTHAGVNAQKDMENMIREDGMRIELVCGPEAEELFDRLDWDGKFVERVLARYRVN
jgi:hypothetical protein